MRVRLGSGQNQPRSHDHYIAVKGVIIDRRVNVGQNVAPAGPNAASLFLIAKDLKEMQLWASVNEADIARIRKGMEARFTVDAFPKKTFKGTVSQIRLNAAMLHNVVTYNVVIDFENPDLRLVPYLTANLKFQSRVVRRCFASQRGVALETRPEQVAAGVGVDTPATNERELAASSGQKTPTAAVRPIACNSA